MRQSFQLAKAYATEYSVNKPQKLKRPIPTELQTNHPTIKYVVRRPDTPVPSSVNPLRAPLNWVMKHSNHKMRNRSNKRSTHTKSNCGRALKV